jgi:hypothetical protein
VGVGVDSRRTRTLRYPTHSRGGGGGGGGGMGGGGGGPRLG